MTNKAFRALVLCAFAAAIAVRTARLDLRPMHADEANQALKFGDLLEQGEYRFDPQDHHGPTLYYLTLPAAWAAGARTLAGLDERVLRLVPALFGAALVLVFLLFSGGLSRRATLAVAALTAVSPALAYYSRFYIQETLLVAFLAVLLGAGWRYARRRSIRWAAVAGVAAGLMYATKETSVLLFAALAGAFGLLSIVESIRTRWHGVVMAGEAWVWRDTRTKLPAARHAVVFLAAGAATAALFYTSFFQHPQGLIDSVRAIGGSVTRAGLPGVHAHPWSYYLQTLAYSRTAGNPFWTEAALLFLAAVGGIAALAGRDTGRDGSPRFLRFILFFTLITTAVYSIIPYKTPWNLLAFYLGLVILGGHGAAVLLRAVRPKPVRAAIAVLLLAGFAFQALQCYRANFEKPSDPANPYVYAQTSPDLLKLVARVNKAAAEAPERQDLLIEVVAPAGETWPLPWYFRKLGRVGYWTSPAAAAEVLPPGRAGVVIAAASFADEVAAGLGEDYDQSFYGLRPEVVLSLFIRKPR
jgi:uncharacterized protein (TIGR03663 family)